jgi:hypothetical protein
MLLVEGDQIVQRPRPARGTGCEVRRQVDLQLVRQHLELVLLATGCRQRQMVHQSGTTSAQGLQRVLGDLVETGRITPERSARYTDPDVAEVGSTAVLGVVRRTAGQHREEDGRLHDGASHRSGGVL